MKRIYAWLGNVITKHYHGDDSDVKILMGGISRAAFGGMHGGRLCERPPTAFLMRS